MNGIFSNPGFMPHIHCYLDRPLLVWTMMVTDLLIGIAYVGIALTLWALIRRIKLTFSFVVLCFGLFIGACGATHFMEVWTLWHPDYWTAAALKVLTAIASVGTGIYLFGLRHTIFQVAESAKLSEQRGAALEKLTQELESRVKSRTKELEVKDLRYQTLIESLPQLVWTCLPDGQCNYLSQQWVDYTGLKLSDQLGMDWLDRVIHPDDRKRTLEHWMGAVQGLHRYDIEYRIRRKDGLYRWFKTRGTPVKDEQGQIIDWFGTCTDIEDQKKSEQQVMDVLESMNDSFFALDSEFVITRVNANQERISSIPRKDSIGRNFYEVFPAAVDSNSKYWTEYHRAMKERVPVFFEEQYAPLGLWTSVNAYPTPDGGLAVFFRDVTAQRNVQTLVESEKQKFEAIFVDSPASMALLRGPHFIFEKVNPKYKELLAGRDLLGKTFNEALPELQNQPFHGLMKQVFETGETYIAKEMLAKLVRHAGSEPEDLYFDFSYSRVVDGEDKPYGIYIHAVDITKTVMARKDIERLAENLQAAVNARDEFLSIASHELKTPLTSLSLQTQMQKRLVEKNDSTAYSKPRVDKLIEQTDKQTLRLTRLVDDMLDIARIRSGKLTLQPESFDLCELVNETIERMQSQFVAAGCGIPKLLLCEPAVGDWDRLRLEQVLDNLFTNAIRYGKGSPVEISVESLPETVRLTVKDYGIGIALEDQLKVFDRYERAVDVNEVSGLGLGLFIVKQIVQAHGGKITIESKTAQGACFRVDLPWRIPKEILE